MNTISDAVQKAKDDWANDLEAGNLEYIAEAFEHEPSCLLASILFGSIPADEKVGLMKECLRPFIDTHVAWKHAHGHFVWADEEAERQREARDYRVTGRG